MRDLFDNKDHIDRAIDRLRAYEPADGYWLGFSGGKDSITLLRLAEVSGGRGNLGDPEQRRFIYE